MCPAYFDSSYLYKHSRDFIKNVERVWYKTLGAAVNECLEVFQALGPQQSGGPAMGRQMN